MLFLIKYKYELDPTADGYLMVLEYANQGTLRKYLQDNGYKTKDNGGNVTVTPVDNPIILTLFLKKQIDGAWVPEPWGARLVNEAGGKILVDETIDEHISKTSAAVSLPMLPSDDKQQQQNS